MSSTDAPFEFLTLRAQRYLDGQPLAEVLASRWPVLSVLKETAVSSMTYGPSASWLRPFLRYGGPPTIIEAGAHDGTDALSYARALGPAVRVWAFEANPRVYETLRGKVG